MKGKIYFTADTHFGSERTLYLSRRKFKDVSSMDDAIISSWNKVVKPKDTVFHLGDFGNAKLIKKLNGRVFLLYGNYERDDDSDIKKYSGIFQSKGGDIIENPIALELTGEETLYLCHEPSKMSTKYFNLFGHVHQLSMVKKHVVSKYKIQCGLNVGWDVFHQPIDLETVHFYKNAVRNLYDKQVFW